MKDLASVNIAANYPIAEDEAQTIRLGKKKEGELHKNATSRLTCAGSSPSF